MTEELRDKAVEVVETVVHGEQVLSCGGDQAVHFGVAEKRNQTKTLEKLL